MKHHRHTLCLPTLKQVVVHLLSYPECPSVRELHVELDEISQLLEVSKEQYDEILSIVQRHADETVKWLSTMAAEFSWVAQAVSNGSAPQNIFSITTVSRSSRRISEKKMGIKNASENVNAER